MNSKITKITIVALLIPVCFLLAACPNKINTEYIKNGDYFRSIVTAELLASYEVNFDSSDTAVSITYQSQDGMKIDSEFMLDGYDHEKKLGYKLVLKDDFEKWKNSRDKGDLKAPDMSDGRLIQLAALQYDFPIVFIWAYQYQDGLSQREIDTNSKHFEESLQELLKCREMMDWAKKGLYDGEWIRDSIEKWALYSFDIDFVQSELPTAEIEYDNKKAVFQVDGFDPQKQIGYIFVTADDEAEWKNQRLMGNDCAPDLTESTLIKQAALNHEFPILFIYVPRYWEVKISKIVGDELYVAVGKNDLIMNRIG